MRLKDKYLDEEEFNSGKKKEGRKVISNEAYAISEMLEKIIKKLEQVRISELR